ncbi:MAG: response regulator transcription factor [Chloroflexi bacterium]|nr:response regulator transcription factor [Chloroflexota bacterium]
MLQAERGFELVAEATDCGAAVTALLRDAPDVAVLDLRLPQHNGLLTTKLMKSLRPSTQVVILSDDDHEEYQRAVREAGASACVAKASLSDSLAPTIRLVDAQERTT